MSGEEVIQRFNGGLDYLIGLDIGTSAVKGVLMSTDGLIVSKERKETEYQSFAGGWIQFDVDQLYRITVDVIRRLTTVLPEGASVAALSIASASGNTVLVDDRGEPMIPAFSWMDTRATNEMQTVFGTLKADDVHELTGWPLLNMFPLAHLSWLKCHRPEFLDHSSKICMSTEYINFKLTGKWGIDNSTATTFYLLDQEKGEWHQPFLQQLGITGEKLPPIHAPGTVLGTITSNAALKTGLPPGTPVVLGSFDHPCAARGSGVLDEGQLLISCGTSWVGFSPVKERQKALRQKMLVDPFLHPAGAWGSMFSLPAISASVDKYIGTYISAGPDRYLAFDKLAGSALPGAGGLIINPMQEPGNASLAGYAKADIARALMEGTVYLFNMQLEKLEHAGIPFSSVAMVGGPSESSNWPQIVSDVLGMEVSAINGASAGSVGAAMLAGIGVGVYLNERDAFQKLAFSKQVLTPDEAAQKLHKDQYREFYKQTHS
ncbi:xylulokinase [Paenibacillus nasutitermitis]|uniref:Xylulokinase n=1 Tax=Paenibacillus nasutitermitis TaxID=1652958 RepID=A0A916YP25_9BACL|nr:FGGY family carbohydrate kinase [Paenibacillus nasutitermitis]GGD53123.1 xylulokinase [Paenibacillus nasutitermitis]